VVGEGDVVDSVEESAATVVAVEFVTGNVVSESSGEDAEVSAASIA